MALNLSNIIASRTGATLENFRNIPLYKYTYTFSKYTYTLVKRRQVNDYLIHKY